MNPAKEDHGNRRESDGRQTGLNTDRNAGAVYGPAGIELRTAAAERNLPYVIERCEKTAGYGMTAMPAASWGACIFTVGIRLWTIRGRFNGWRGMGNRNTPGMICRALLSAGIRLPAGPGAGKSILGENQGFAL